MHPKVVPVSETAVAKLNDNEFPAWTMNGLLHVDAGSVVARGTVVVVRVVEVLVRVVVNVVEVPVVVELVVLVVVGRNSSSRFPSPSAKPLPETRNQYN